VGRRYSDCVTTAPSDSGLPQAPEQDTEILLSARARGELAEADAGTQKFFTTWLREYFHRLADEDDDAGPLTGDDGGIRAAVAPAGSVVVYRALDEDETSRFNAAKGYLIADIVGLSALSTHVSSGATIDPEQALAGSFKSDVAGALVGALKSDVARALVGALKSDIDSAKPR